MAWTKTGNIRGPQGAQGPQGDAGPPGAPGADGAQGEAGTGIQFQGSVATVGDLPGSADQGDAYLVQADDSLWIFDSTDFVSGGSIQGPPGPSGAAGAPGATGTRGSLWHSIVGSPQGAITVGNIVGDQSLDTATGDVWEWT